MYFQTVVKPNAEEVAVAAVEWLIETIRECIAERGRCTLALSGGSTPKRLYEHIAAHELSSLDWSKVTLLWGDERNVPHDHADSNYRMVREAWLNRLGPDTPASAIPQVFPVPVDPTMPERTAADYAQTLRTVLASSTDDSYSDGISDPDEAMPSIDVVLLGLGDDAHTASLFPETDALLVSNDLFVANYIPKFSAYRLTMTAPLINAAKNVAFLVCGESKQAAVEVVLHGPRHPQQYPAQLIQPDRGRLWWFLDSASSFKP